MNRRFVTLTLAALALTATGCERKAAMYPPSSSNLLRLDKVAVSAYAASPQRFTAERDKLDVVTSESGLQKSWESVVAFCGTIRCEVISSSIATRTAESAPSGNVSLRVAPDDLGKLLAHVPGLGKIAQHTTEREDETASVVDTEARIKNLTSFRDNLRAMLAKPSATVSNVVEIDKQLTDTQSELDSETAQRKILTEETEKIAVEISFRVEEPNVAIGGFSEIWTALRESGSVLGDSIANLITTIVAIIPWLILILPAFWLLAKAWRKLRLRRQAKPPAAV